jgi:hypothetical protein
MGFIKKLFGGDKKPEKYVDKRGVYFYVLCDNCGTVTRLRADKEYDLIREGDGFTWHKTVVDNRCFRQMPAVVHLDSNYQVTSEEISGGQFVSEEDYNAFLEPDKNAGSGEDRDDSDQNVANQ